MGERRRFTPINLEKAEIDQQLGNLLQRQNPYERPRQIQSFIAKRLDQLTERSIPTDLSVSHSLVEGFIHPATSNRVTGIYVGFLIDDPTIYEDLIENIIRRRYDPDRKSYVEPFIDPSIFAVQRTLNKYFGRTMDARPHYEEEEFYRKQTELFGDNFRSSSGFSMREFRRNRGIAACGVLAPVAQNLFTFLGYDSSLVVFRSSKNLHAFNIVTLERGKGLFEPTNPVLVFNLDGRVFDVFPALYYLGPAEYKVLVQGKKIEINHRNIQVSRSTISYGYSTAYTQPEKRTYQGPLELRFKIADGDFVWLGKNQ